MGVGLGLRREGEFVNDWELRSRQTLSDGEKVDIRRKILKSR